MMLPFLADEDLDNRIFRAFRRRSPTIDCVRVQDVGLSGSDDELLLQFAAQEQRVVLTHDVSTMTAAAFQRVEQGGAMPGLIVIPHRMGIGPAVEELILLAQESASEEWSGQVLYLPL
jgi:hypothetical protein